MTTTHIFLLSLLQGITEFLPISSSGHLYLLSVLTALPDQGVLIDVSAHVGTLFAVLFYFRRDIVSLSRGGAVQLCLATLPTVLCGGLLVLSGGVAYVRNPIIIASAMCLFALPLYLADRYGSGTIARVESLSWRGGVVIGLAQIFALVPGASRAGVTITAGRALGLSRSEAVRFSMLCAIPIIALSGAYSFTTLTLAPDGGALGSALLVAVLSGVVAFATIGVFLRFVERVGLLPFVLYRLVVGILLLWLYL